MRNSTLPKRLKSGRRLVATSARGTIGLYQGDGDALEDFVIVMPDRRIVRPKRLSRQGHPKCPSGNRWSWAAKREERKRRGRRRDRTAPSFEHRPRPIPVNKAAQCRTCERDVSKADHYHTKRDASGFVEALCCMCSAKQGFVCFFRYQRLRERYRRGELSSAAMQRLRQMLVQRSEHGRYERPAKKSGRRRRAQ